MNISYNALTGNTETRNEFEGNGAVEQVIRPERKSLQSSFKSQDWLFRHDMSADIRAEEAEAEGYVRALMAGNMSEDYRMSYGFYMLSDE